MESAPTVYDNVSPTNGYIDLIFAFATGGMTPPLQRDHSFFSINIVWLNIRLKLNIDLFHACRGGVLPPAHLHANLNEILPANEMKNVKHR